MMMRAIALCLLLVSMAWTTASAQEEKTAKIEFEETTHDFGEFDESDGNQVCVFTYTNTGTAPLVLNQVRGSCGCTVPSYTKKPLQPGDTGTIKVTYKVGGTYPGRFMKTVTVRSNADTEVVRLHIKGIMKRNDSD